MINEQVVETILPILKIKMPKIAENIKNNQKNSCYLQEDEFYNLLNVNNDVTNDVNLDNKNILPKEYGSASEEFRQALIKAVDVLNVDYKNIYIFNLLWSKDWCSTFLMGITIC